LKGFFAEWGYVHNAATAAERYPTMTPRDPLDDLLDHWQPATPANRDLTAQIHRAIAATHSGAKESWLLRLAVAFARPSFAVAFVAACVLLGLFLAESRISNLHAAYSAQIARNYVQLIDPLIVTSPAHPADRKDRP
jgi:hypothetical protein